MARAYLDQLAASLAKPTSDEVKKYYGEHPELFADRRIFSIEELVTSKKVSIAAVKERVTKTKDLSDLAAWIKSQNAPVSAQRGVRAAEQIPLPWLSEMQKMKEGEVHVFENGERLNIVRLVAVRSAPVDEATATPRIQQFVFNRRFTDAIAKDINDLRQKSNIEYMGEFANCLPETKTAPAPEPFQPPVETPQQPAEGTPNFEKGLRGLR